MFTQISYIHKILFSYTEKIRHQLKSSIAPNKNYSLTNYQPKMRKFTLHLLALALFLGISSQLFAQIPSGYYSVAEGKKMAELKTALYNIIKDPKVLNYGSGNGATWSGFAKTDIRPEDGTVWDMYSNNHVKMTGLVAAPGMNIEHSFAQSWWNNSSMPLRRDIHHLNPSDTKANSAKGSFPMAIVDGSTKYDNGVIKVGKSSSRPGETIDAWEPADEYKGDFARQYMYVVTCYENYSDMWTGNSVNQLDNNTYPVFEEWTYKMLLDWCRKDPVSDKEKKRNEEVYKIQGNRNPYIDYPDLAEYVWGAKTETPWHSIEVTTPTLYSPIDKSTIDFGATAINGTIKKEVSISAQNLTGDLTLAITGNGFTTSTTTITKEQATKGLVVTIEYASATASASKGQLTINGGGISATIALTAEAVDGIPAQAAEYVTSTSFLAKWTNIGIADNYEFSLYDANKTLIADYPKSVLASIQEYQATGLTPETTYFYKVTVGSLSSKMVEVKTAIAVPTIAAQLLDDELEFITLPNETSKAKSVSVKTEFLKNAMTATVEEPFELSIDKEHWVKSLNLGTENCTFSIRMAASALGEYKSTLVISTPDVEENEELAVSGSSEVSRPFFEDFEKGSKNDYKTALAVDCSMSTWVFDKSMLGNQSDLKNGLQSVRLGKDTDSGIYMNSDRLNGAKDISFYTGTFPGKDVITTLQLSYSIDGGNKWEVIEENVPVSKTFTKYTYPVNIDKPIRFKICKTKGTSRVNIDDVAIVDYRSSTGIESAQKTSFSCYSNNGKLNINSDEELNLRIINISGQVIFNNILSAGCNTLSLPNGFYFLVANGSTQKIIIK